VLAHAAIDWDWQLPAVALAALACGGAVLIRARPERVAPATSGRARGVALGLLLPLIVFAIVTQVGNSALAKEDTTGAPISTIDGSTWDPFAQRLLFTTESASAPTYAATPDYPSTVEDVSGALGRGGYEGIQNDSDGNIWMPRTSVVRTSPGRRRRSRTVSSTATSRRIQVTS
jgi:hypothetical protein